VSLNTELYQTPEPLLAKLKMQRMPSSSPPLGGEKKITNVTSVMLKINGKSGSMKNILAGYITIL